MKIQCNLVNLISLAIFFVGCSTSESRKINLFKNNGKAIDSLKTAYKANSIKFDKWEASGVTDSTFSICLVDAKKLPDHDMDAAMKQFQSIAKSMKYALKDNTKYNSYQIVFVETHEGFGEGHRAGTTVGSKGL